MQTLSLTRNEVTESMTVPEGDHLVGRFEGDPVGPTVIIFGSIHGNEQSGVKALKRVAETLKDRDAEILGRIFLVAGNTRAINQNVRFIESDLNRHWTAENVSRNSPSSSTATKRPEDSEQRELLLIIEDALRDVRNEVYALDLHSTSSESTPFAMIGDTLRNRTFAEKFPATFLLGIEEQLDGTIMEYMNDLGAVTLGFEAGQHTTDIAINSQEAMIWLALRYSGAIGEDTVNFKHYYDYLTGVIGDERIIEIRHRHSISPADNFKMEPGYSNFMPVKKGELLARDNTGEIKAKETGLILMPLYQQQGSDGFFLGREINRFWLRLSRVLRERNIGSWMRFLPGVNQHPVNDRAFVVNTRIARLMPLQVFHLLGFRKMRWRNEKLIVSRRRHDTKSPFTA